MGEKSGAPGLSRRAFLSATAASAAAVSLRPSIARAASPERTRSRSGDPAKGGLFGQLDAKIEAGMDAYGIPGAAVGVFHEGREYVKGYGVTNVDYPVAVDGDTVFRICSTTKTFTGTTLMRLVDQGKVHLDALCGDTSRPLPAPTGVRRRRSPCASCSTTPPASWVIPSRTLVRETTPSRAMSRR